jgi:hypothetical protein
MALRSLERLGSACSICNTLSACLERFALLAKQFYGRHFNIDGFWTDVLTHLCGYGTHKLVDPEMQMEQRKGWKRISRSHDESDELAAELRVKVKSHHFT